MGDDQRHVAFEACFNFRDLGGYPGAEGREVRWGRVFRADALQRLTPDDLAMAAGLGLRTVLDLRSTAERTHFGTMPALEGVTVRHVPVFEDLTVPFVPPDRDAPPPPLGEMYLGIAERGADAFTAALRAIATDDHAAVFHCSAGKDRTGILAALLLSLLGVADDLVVADYALTERSHARASAWAQANDREWAGWIEASPAWVLAAPPEAMESFLSLLRGRYGSVERYLEDGGLEPEVPGALRSRLLG